MSRVAIVGASGRLGQKLVARALDLGLNVNALARDPGKLHFHHEHVTIIRGDALTGVGLDALVTGCRHVVFAMGSNQPVIAQCLANVVQQMAARPMLGRLVFISCAVAHQLEVPDKPGLLGRLWGKPHRAHAEDLASAEALLGMSGLDSVVLRATHLNDDLHKRQVVTVPHSAPAPGPIARAALAEFVMDLVGKAEWHLGEVTIGTK